MTSGCQPDSMYPTDFSRSTGTSNSAAAESNTGASAARSGLLRIAPGSPDDDRLVEAAVVIDVVATAGAAAPAGIARCAPTGRMALTRRSFRAANARTVTP